MKNKIQPKSNSLQPDSPIPGYSLPMYVETETSVRAFDGATVKWRRRKISPWEWSTWTIINVTPKKD